MSGLTICERCKHEKLINSFCKLGIIGTVLKRAGHPIAQASAAAGKIEFLNVPEADEWDACMWVRYRSRSDFAEMIIETWGSEHHGYKLDALERTFAFPSSPWFVLGGPKLLLALLLALAAAITHIIFV